MMHVKITHSQALPAKIINGCLLRRAQKSVFHKLVSADPQETVLHRKLAVYEDALNTMKRPEIGSLLRWFVACLQVKMCTR